MEEKSSMGSRRVLRIIAASLTLGLGLSACATAANSNSGGGPASSGSGSATTKARSLSDLHIGFFGPGTANSYAALITNSAAPEAKKLGVHLATISGNFDVQTQVNQLQQALQRKTYNAWVVVPLDPNQECSILQQAEKAGIAVMMAVTPACTDYGPVGGVGVVAVQTEALYQQWWDYIFSHNKPQNFALLTGDAVDFVTKACLDALHAALKKHPGFKSVSTQNISQYSTQDAYTDGQDVLRANPGLKLIVSDYSGMTQAVIQAVSQAGKTGTVRVYDMDGDHDMVNFIKAGKLAMTIPGLPISESQDSVKLLTEWWQGKSVPKINNPLSTQTFSGVPFVTKANASLFKPQY